METEELVAILAKHAEPGNVGCSTFDECVCGWRGVDYRAHVASMVLESDWLRQRDGDKWAEGHRAPRRMTMDITDGNPYRADRVDAADFADELPAHIEESMKDPEYAAADALHREAEAAWKSWVPSMFADDENMHTAYVSGYKDRAPRVVLPPTQRTTTETTRPTGRSVTF